MKKVRGVRANPAPTRWITDDVTQSVLETSTKALNLPREHLALVTQTIDPCDFFTAESFRRSYWAVEMWSKYPFPIPGIDREEVARKAFLDAERVCAKSNARLHDLFNKPETPEGIRRVLQGAKRRLERLFHGFSVDEIAEHARWGPGSSTSLPRQLATPSNKWAFAGHITEECTPYLAAYEAFSGWKHLRDPKIVKGNKVTFVPKNSKTDRSIAIEPDWNSFFQLGLGGAIRRRLQRWGVLLPIAQSINQRLAKRGSSDGFLATIDLKAASDTISLALVEELLPASVLPHVLNLRSRYGTLDKGKTWFAYEKVSSMGNGMTFELETALFWAIADSAAGHAMAYGDDLIVPSAAVGWVATVLDYCGFQLNEKKTHYGDSPFRESCGGHYFKSVDVTPVYVREPLTSVTRLAFCNHVRKSVISDVMLDLLPVWRAAAQGVPRCFRGPSSVDGVLHSEWDEAVPKWDAKLQCWSGFRLIRKHREGLSVQRGALRDALRRSGTISSFSKLPGIPIDVVGKWKHDEWGLRSLSPASPS